jgi:S1-C subfamily serine protease
MQPAALVLIATARQGGFMARSVQALFVLGLALLPCATAFAQSAPMLQPAAVAAASPPTPAQQLASQAEVRKLSDAFVGVAERVSPSVVQIDVTVRDDAQDGLLRWLGASADSSPVSRGMGSGVVFTPDGAIVTNNHVIENALTINVHLRDGRFLPGRLIGRDPATDLAVIKVDAQGLVAARFADSDAMRVGEWMVAIGSPFGLGYTVTTGVLSAKGRGGLGMNAIEDYLQTDAGINPGNSGGPLCNLDGQVVGINTMVVGRGSGIGFAVPSNLARRAAEQILRIGHVERAWLGVTVQDLTPDLAGAMKLDPRAGALVNMVAEGGPGAKAQLHPGDVLASVGGKPVHDSHEFVREVLAHDVGQALAIEVLRNGQRYGATVNVVARPEAPIAPVPAQQASVPQVGFGMALRDLAPQQAQQLGLASRPVAVVTSVSPGSSADRSGVKPGDVVVEADGKSEPTSAEVQVAAADGMLVLRLKRGESQFYAAVKR